MMLAYILRRTLLLIPTILGIVLLVFVLFTYVSPDPARAYAGKRTSEEELKAIRVQMGLDKPRWINIDAARERGIKGFFDSQFFDILLMRFNESMYFKESIRRLFIRKAPISLAIQLPAFIIELGLQLVLALYVASRRGRWPDYTLTFLAVLGMSLPSLSIYLGVQWLFGAVLPWFPVAGWESGFYALHFMALPILVTVLVNLGSGMRFYRTVVLEEINSDYVRTARAKGVSQREVLLTHVLRNVMIPVITNTVAALPLLFMGSLLLERLFQIPGFGGLLVDAIFNNDRPLVMAIVYVTSLAYCLMLLMTDICYAWADPRVALR